MDCIGCGYPLVSMEEALEVYGDEYAYEPGPYCGECEA